MRALVTVFGPWVGFEVWRCLLITLIVGSVYAAGTITGRSRVLAGSLSIFVGLNTVVLAFVGNTYLTGTAIAAMFALITVSLSFLGSHGATAEAYSALRGGQPVCSPVCSPAG